MRRSITALMLGTALIIGGCHKAADQTAQTNAAAPAAGAVQDIAWREGDVDDAFAEAKEAGKPVLLYWGAKWCPPCNLMKQSLFKDPAFIAETRDFVPVHLDGDAKGAQLWGEKFGIQGYPTVIILRPDRSEVTRLAGGGTPGALADVLKLTARRTSSTEDLLARAAHPASLSPDDWRLLASYDYLDDPRHFGDPAKGAAFLSALAKAAPTPAMQRHFALTGLWMGNSGEVAKLTPEQQAEVRTLLPAILASYDEVKANRQELSFGAVPLLRGLPVADRKALGTPGSAASRSSADIALAKADGGSVPPAVLAKVRQRVAMADEAATDPMMRQAVIPHAGDLLDAAGDNAAGAKLLEANLSRAVAPYYLMADLSGLAESRKDNKAAIEWSRKAAEAAQGPATRVQWAIGYSDTVLRLAPADTAQVEKSAAMVIAALGADDAGYAERTKKKATAWAKTLKNWSATHDGAAVLARLQGEMGKACRTGGCDNVLTA